MFRKEIKSSQITELILWIVGYFPVVLVILVKYFFSEDKPETIWNNTVTIARIKVNFQILLFLIIIVLTFCVFKLSLVMFLKAIKRKIADPHAPKISRIASFRKLSLDKYSFFILSLMLPFIFESGESIFDLLIIFSLIFILIVVMIKMNQITVNPVFLFSKLYVLDSMIIEFQGDKEKEKKVIIITNYKIDEIENFENQKYNNYFTNVYFIIK